MEWQNMGLIYLSLVGWLFVLLVGWLVRHSVSHPACHLIIYLISYNLISCLVV